MNTYTVKWKILWRNIESGKHKTFPILLNVYDLWMLLALRYLCINILLSYQYESGLFLLSGMGDEISSLIF